MAEGDKLSLTHRLARLRMAGMDLPATILIGKIGYQVSIPNQPFVRGHHCLDVKMPPECLPMAMRSLCGPLAYRLYVDGADFDVACVKIYPLDGGGFLATWQRTDAPARQPEMEWRA